MRRSTGTQVTIITRKNGSGTRTRIYRAPTWLPNSLSNLSTAFARSGHQTLSLPMHNNINATTTASLASEPPARQQMLHLMACLQRGRYRRIVHQDRIEGITTDRALFAFLKNQTARHRGRMRKLFSLKSVQGIHFVKVSIEAVLITTSILTIC